MVEAKRGPSDQELIYSNQDFMDVLDRNIERLETLFSYLPDDDPEVRRECFEEICVLKELNERVRRAENSVTFHRVH